MDRLPAAGTRRQHRPLVWTLVVTLGSLSAPLTATPRGQNGSPQVFSTPRGEAENVRFVLLGNAQVQIDYDLVSSDPRAVFAVTLEASQDGGATFGMRPQSIRGDVGPNISAGRGKRILWDSGKDVERVQIDQFRFRIVATAGPLAPLPAEQAATSALSIVTAPSGATVMIDGTPRGVSPLRITDLEPGSHRVVVTKTGYLENSRVVAFAPGGNDTLTVTLTPGQPPPVVKPAGKGGSKAKWLIPLGAAAGGAAAFGAKSSGGGSGGGTSTTPPPTGGTGGCTFTPSATTFSQLPKEGGGPQTVNVTTTAGCAWTATSNSAFIRIVDRTSFTGSDGVVFTVDPQTESADRIGTLTVAGSAITVTQVGPPFATVIGLNPPSGSTVPVSPAGGNVTATIRYYIPGDTGAVCAWPDTRMGFERCNSGPLLPRGSGTTTVQFRVDSSATNLPITTTQLYIWMANTLPLQTQPRIFESRESATFTWTRP